MKKKTWIQIWEILSPVLLYYLISNLVILFLMSLTQGSLFGTGIRNHILENGTFYSAVIRMSGMVSGGLAVYRYYRVSIPIEEQMRNNRLGLKATGLLGVTGAVTAILVNLMFSMLHITESSESYSQVAETQFALPFWLAVISYGVVSPLTEELVFRGVLFNKIKEHYGVTIAVVGSAVIFGVFHGNLVQGLYGSLMGILMAMVYQRYQTLSAPVLFHAAANIAVYCMVTIPLAY